MDGNRQRVTESLDAGETWSRQNRGLPNVPITRITTSHDREELPVVTPGRGLFVVNASEVEGIMPPDRVSIEEAGVSVPREIPTRLSYYPNPFASSTSLQFTTQQSATVRLEVFEVLGRRIKTVVDQRYIRGEHLVRWNGGALSAECTLCGWK